MGIGSFRSAESREGLLLPAFPSTVALANPPFLDSDIAGVVYAIALVFLSDILRLIRILLDLDGLIRLIPRLRRASTAAVRELQAEGHPKEYNTKSTDLVSAPPAAHSRSFVGNPYPFLEPFPVSNNISPPLGGIAEAVVVQVVAPQEAEPIGRDVLRRGHWRLSSPLADWADVRLADSGRGVIVDNRGWLPVVGLVVQSSPSIFRSAVSGSPSDRAVCGRLEARSSALLHIDDETIRRARMAASFYGTHQRKVTVIVRFFDWFVDDHRELPPFYIWIPADTASSDSGEMYGA